MAWPEDPDMDPPAAAQPVTPDTSRTAAPGTGQTAAPGTSQTVTPAAGRTATPATPAAGQTATPAAGQTATPADAGRNAARRDGPGRGGQRRGRRTDLRARTFPLLQADQWRHPGEALTGMYRDAENRAIEAYDWYLADRIRKRTYSRLLRALAIILAAAGGLQPLISAASSKMGFAWGYVLLASAGICVGFDHFFGISTRWMRDVVTAQKLQQRLQKFQLDWASLDAAGAFAPDAESGSVHKYLDLLRDFITDMSGIMMDETAEWVAEFQTGIAQLKHQTTRQ
jgi:SMODS and SLOG-associating 2TM effector domain 2